MRTMHALPLAAAIALAALAVSFARGDEPAPRQGRLVCVIVVDQFRADYLEKWKERLEGKELLDFLKEGAVFQNARFRHATTQTGPGHATIATGGHANRHGIVGNHWLDREEGSLVYCAEDQAHQVIVGEGLSGEAPPVPRKVEMTEGHQAELLAHRKSAGTSPRNLRVSTIGDEIVMSDATRPGANRVVAVSIKDRSAIFLGGRLGKAFWWDPAIGGFTTSTYYAKEMPGWAAAFDAARPGEQWRGKAWERLLPEGAYGPLMKGEPGFPHVLPGPDATPKKYNRALVSTPFGNDLVLELARAAVRGEELGKRAGATDFLGVSLSSNDIVGHAYGPDSQEVMDTTLRTVKALAEFLAFLEAEVGRERLLVVLTADHGVSMTPEMATARGFESGRIDPKELVARAKAALDARHGEDAWVLGFVFPNLYLDHVRLKAKEVDAVAAEREVAAALRAVPGVGYAFTRADLLRGIAPPTHIGHAVALAFDGARSGDVVLVAAPYWYLDQDPHEDRATHGTPYTYDNHVPLVLRGFGIRGGTYERAVSPADIAPTIARVLGIEQPSGCEGEPLVEAISR